MKERCRVSEPSEALVDAGQIVGLAGGASCVTGGQAYPQSTK
jgi:hypothetical protein